MNLNLKVRLKNPTYIVTLISTILLIVKIIASAFGYELDLTTLEDNLINVALGILAIAGVTNDPTVSGLSDSSQAMTYTEPKTDQDLIGGDE